MEDNFNNNNSATIALDNIKILQQLLNVDAIRCSATGDNVGWVTILLSVLRVSSIYLEDDDINEFRKRFSEVNKNLKNREEQMSVATQLDSIDVDLRLKLKKFLNPPTEFFGQ